MLIKLSTGSIIGITLSIIVIIILVVIIIIYIKRKQ